MLKYLNPFNYFKYIDDNYREISDMMSKVFVQYVKQSVAINLKKYSKYFEPDEPEPDESQLADITEEIYKRLQSLF